MVFPCQAHTEPLPRKGYVGAGVLLLRSSCTRAKETPRRAFSSQEAGMTPGSQDPLPGRTCHPILLNFTTGTSSSFQKAAHGGSEAFTSAQAYSTALGSVCPWKSLSISAEGLIFFVLHIWANFPWNPLRWHTGSWSSLSDKKKKKVHFKRSNRETSWPIFFLGVGRLSCKGVKLRFIIHLNKEGIWFNISHILVE